MYLFNTLVDVMLSHNLSRPDSYRDARVNIPVPILRERSYNSYILYGFEEWNTKDSEGLNHASFYS